MSLSDRRAPAMAPILITGLSHSGKTELRRALESSPGVWLSRDEAARGSDAVLAATAAAAARGGFARWGVQRKSLEWDANTILAEMPDAYFIHLVRHPLDRAVSLGRHRHPVRLGWEYAVWAMSARRAAAMADRHSDRYHVVRTEDLAEAPGATVDRLRALLGLDPGEDDAQVDWTRLGPGADRTLDLGVARRIRSRTGHEPAISRRHGVGALLGRLGFWAGTATMWTMRGGRRR